MFKRLISWLYGSDDGCYMPEDMLDDYIKKTRPELYGELQRAFTYWEEAEIYTRDSGIHISPCDLVIDTRQKLFDYYVSKDVK